MRRTIRLRLLTCALTTGMLLAGLAGGLQLSQAHAGAMSAAVGNPHGKPGGGMKGHKLQDRPFAPGFQPLSGVAALLDMDDNAIADELKRGKTLVQLAWDRKGWNEEVLMEKLSEAQRKVIDEAVQSGKLTQEQADKQKEFLSQRLKMFVERAQMANRGSGFRGGAMPGHGPGRGFMPGMWGNPEALASILGVTPQELNKELNSGKSLAEIAQEHGID